MRVLRVNFSGALREAVDVITSGVCFTTLKVGGCWLD
jgi:hypothetical protein